VHSMHVERLVILCTKIWSSRLRSLIMVHNDCVESVHFLGLHADSFPDDVVADVSYSLLGGIDSERTA
jgi:hypothetical protein